MPGSFSYNAGINTVTVTGGTSGSPADFASFVAADRAGTETSLLTAWAPNSNTKALTYQVRPVELLALLISFVVASKTAETDYIFITGTDAWGAAQTESLNVSAGNGTYITTKRFQTITNIDCSDNPAGSGTVWANGTVAVTQPIWGVIWNKGNGQYQTDSYVSFGNGSTSTYFLTTEQQIVFYIIGPYWAVTANAVFVSGTVVNASTKTSKRGSSFISYINASQNLIVNSGGTIYFYSSMFDSKLGTSTIINANRVWNSIANGYSYFQFNSAPPDLYNFSIQGNYSAGFRVESAITIDGMHVTGSGGALFFWDGYGGPFIARNCVMTDNGAKPIVVYYIHSPMYLIDCFFDYWGITETYPCLADIYRQQSFNLHVVDTNGSNLVGATVTLKDKNNTTVFSTNTGADGKIAEQIITVTQYDHTNSWAAINYGPFTLTITNTGYQDYQDVITIDRKMDLEVAMLAAVSGTGALFLRRR